MKKVSSLVGDMPGCFLQQRDSFSTAIAAPVAPRYFALRAPQLRLGFPIEARILDLRSVGQDRERSQSHIDADCFSGIRELVLATLGGEAGIPLASLPSNRHGLNAAIDGAMELDLDKAGSLDSEASVRHQAAAIPVGRERNAVEAPGGPKRGKTVAFSAGYAAEECLVRLVDAPKNVLAAGEIGKLDQPFRSHLLKLLGLIVVVDRLVAGLPSAAPFFEGAVVEVACFAELRFKKGGLRFGLVEPIFESAKHLLLRGYQSRAKTERRAHSAVA
jgi:hypothetical protein